MIGTTLIYRGGRKVKNVKYPPLHGGASLLPLACLPSLSRPKAKPRRFAGAVAVLVMSCGGLPLEEGGQRRAELGDPLVYGDVADTNGGGDFPLSHAPCHTVENDLVGAV